VMTCVVVLVVVFALFVRSLSLSVEFDGTEMVCPRRAILREFRTVRRWTEKPME
jgi:hypothetical protein